MRKTHINKIDITNYLGVSDPETVELPKDEETDVDDRPPHLVFLISGIRSDGMWAQKIIESQFNSEGRPIEFRSVRGNNKSSTGRLHTGHLITRLGINGFRKNIVQNIDIWSKRLPDSPISIFAHSMGSSLLAEAMPEIKTTLEKRGLQLHVVALLGSICHRKHSPQIFDSCKIFINDIGVLDMLPWRASTIRPYSYSDVGLWAFGDGRPIERRFSNNHSSCTSEEHVEQYLLPFLSEQAPLTTGTGAWPNRSYNTHHYVRKGIQIFGLACIPLLIILLLTTNIFVALAIPSIVLIATILTLFMYK
jgi:hypothetical protein